VYKEDGDKALGYKIEETRMVPVRNVSENCGRERNQVENKFVQFRETSTPT